MNTTTNNGKPPTAKQLAYLRTLANRAGQSFANPGTSTEASREITRLKGVKATGFTFAEQQRHKPVGYAPAVQEREITGYGSTATWNHGS